MNKWKTDLISWARDDPRWNSQPVFHKFAGSACSGVYRSDLAMRCDVCTGQFQTKNAFMIYKKDNHENKTALDALYNGSVRWMTNEKGIAEDLEIMVDTEDKVHDRVHHDEVHHICFLCHGRKEGDVNKYYLKVEDKDGVTYQADQIGWGWRKKRDKSENAGGKCNVEQSVNKAAVALMEKATEHFKKNPQEVLDQIEAMKSFCLIKKIRQPRPISDY